LLVEVVVVEVELLLVQQLLLVEVEAVDQVV
jgi:hypothetical protein